MSFSSFLVYVAVDCSAGLDKLLPTQILLLPNEGIVN